MAGKAVILPANVRSVSPTEVRRRAPRATKRPSAIGMPGPSARALQQEDPTFGEIGTTGLRQYGGFVLEEWLARLRGKWGAWAYREMMDNSPIAGGIIFAIKMLAKQCEWEVEDDVELSYLPCGFVESNMHDMSHTWGDTVSEALSMIGYGWALHELVYKRRQGGDPLPEAGFLEVLGGDGAETEEDPGDVPPSSQYSDGLIGWRRIPVRAQETLMRWKFRGYSGLRGMEQVDWHGGKHLIPIQKALLFRTETTRNNPEGRSMLRNAWTSYYAIQNIQAIEAIGIERDLAGIPVATPPEGVDLYSPENAELRAEVQELVTTIRKDEDEGVVLPSNDWKLELLSTGGARQIDTDAVIRRYENRMTTSVLADFLMIGQDSVGSYAMVDVKAELFGVAVDAILDMICEVYNRYAIPRLLALNGMKPDKRPKIKHSSAGRIDLRLVGEFLSNLSVAGAPIPWTEDMINHLFRAGAMPAPDWNKAKLLTAAQPSPVARDSLWRPSWGDENKTTSPAPAPPTEREHVAKAEQRTGAMVALYPAPEIASRIALTGGEDPAELHVTLAFLGDARDIKDGERLHRVVEGFAASTPPISGYLAGTGTFTAGEEPVTYASPDLPGLPTARHRLVDALEHAGFPPTRDHGFTPHITLAYGAERPPSLPALPLTFDRISVVLGGERADFPFSGEAIAKAQARPGEGTLIDLTPVFHKRQQLLAAQLERELEGALAELGGQAALAYAGIAQKSMTPRSVERLVGGVMAKGRVREWVRGRLQPLLRNHAARVAADTARTVGTETGQMVALSDADVRSVVAAAGKHLKIRDIEPQVRENVKSAILEGAKAGDTPARTADRIRQSVPAGRFRLAGSKWRAQMIARDETANMQRQASVASYEQMDGVSHLQVSDGVYGPPRSDEPCMHRDGEVLRVEDALTAAKALHPLCTVTYSPIVQGSLPERIAA